MESIQYGVRATWPDGHTEVRESRSRHDAETDVRHLNDGAARRGSGEEFLVVHRVVSAWSTGMTS
jgi:hypothetical protein